MNISLKISFYFLLASSVLLTAGTFIFSTPQGSNLLYISPLFLFLFIYSILSIFRDKAFYVRRFEAVYFLFLFFYLFLGIYNQNSFKNILYDFAILGIPILTFVVSKNFFSKENNEINSLDINLNWLIVFCIPVIVLFGSSTALFMLIVLYFVFFSSQSKSLKGVLFVFIILMFIALKGSKTYLLILIFNYFLMQKLKGKVFQPLFFLTIGFIVILILNSYFYDQISSVSKTAFKLFALLNRLDVYMVTEAVFNLDNELLWESVDTSTGQRLFELITVIKENLENNSLIIGEGLGATSDLSNTKDQSIVVRRASGNVSNVRVFHLMFSWLTKKVGILGLLLFMWFLFTLFKQYKSHLTGKVKYIYYCIWVTFIIRIGITFGAFLVHYYIPIILGYFAALNSYCHNRNKLQE